MSRSRTTRLLGVLAGAATGLVVVAGPASAHVTVQPPSAPAGDFATLSFQVPNESDTASTVGLDVQLPTDTPIPSVSVQPKSGWTYEMTRGKSPKPVTVEGAEVAEVVTRIAWKAAPGNPGVRPGEFDTFTVSAGPLPEGADALTFKVLQTYSDGKVARWIDVAAPGAEEPEHPAPVLRLTAATGDGNGGETATAAGGGAATARPAETTAGSETAGDGDGTARALGIAGLVVGASALGLAGFVLATRRRRGTPA
jgi:uncharacterized protein